MTPEKKKIVIIAVAALVFGAGMFAAGRYTLPVKVVEVEKQVEVIKEVVKTEIQIVEKKVYVRGEDRDVVREVIVIKRPDGTEETHTTETDRTRIKEASSQETDTRETKVVDREVIKEVEKLKIVEAEKDWHLSLSAGAGARFIGEVTPQLALGFQAERRIIGPFFMGVRADVLAGIKPTAAVPLGPPVTVTGSLVFGLGF